MHILLGVLGAIVTILILVHRLSDNGIDLGWLNPFAWKRRREWANKYHANPIFSLRSPMEVTAVLMVALAKSDGEISSEQKQEIKNKFKEIFHLNEEKSSSLFTASSFLLKEDLQAVKNIDKLLEPSIKHFTEEQASSALQLMTHIANFDSPANAFQQEIIEGFKNAFRSKYIASKEWA